MWSEVREPVEAGRPGRAARLLAPAAIAALLWAAGRGRLALLVLVGGLVTMLLAVQWPSAERALVRAVDRVARAVVTVLRVVLLGSVLLLVIAPAALFHRVVRRDPLDTEAGRWWPRDPGVAGAHRRAYALEGPAAAPASHRAPRRRRLVPAALGLLVVLVVADAGIGYAWDELVGSHDPPAGTAALAGHDPRAATAAMEASPWAPAYFEALGALGYHYEPYLYQRADDVRGAYINVQDGVRRSYEPPGAESDLPEIWFFGGAALWGEGQRDLHTIPSEVARLAEAAGTPVRVVNFAERGDTSWQEVLTFERALAHRPAPAAAVFYDGVGDVGVQVTQTADPDPTHFQADAAFAAWTGRARSVESDAGEDDLTVEERTLADDLSDLAARYRKASVAAKAYRRVLGLFTGGPDTTVSAEATLPGPGGDAARRAVEDAADVYLRSQDLARFLARSHGVAPLFFWQPVRPAAGGFSAIYSQVTERVADDVIDVSGRLAGTDPASVFIDDTNTNEAGARTMARALWPQVAGALEAAAATREGT